MTRLPAWTMWPSSITTSMSDLSLTRSVIEAGNPPASPGVTHSDVVVNLFREFAPHAGVPGTVAPSATPPLSPDPGSLPASPAVPLPAPALPGGGSSSPGTPPPIQPSIGLESAETTNAVTSRIPVSFEPFGSEVLKSLQESGLGISTFDEPSLPLPHGATASPDYYFLAQQP